jgi:hypothetical protein
LFVYVLPVIHFFTLDGKTYYDKALPLIYFGFSKLSVSTMPSKGRATAQAGLSIHDCRVEYLLLVMNLIVVRLNEVGNVSEEEQSRKTSWTGLPREISGGFCPPSTVNKAVQALLAAVVDDGLKTTIRAADSIDCSVLPNHGKI